MSLRTSILRMVAEAFPALVYGYPRTYVVSAVHADGRLDLDPPPDAQHLAPLKNAEQWSVATMEPEVGTEVVVMFRDANAGRYIVVGARAAGEETISPPGVLGSPPPFTAIPSVAGRVVRFGDSVIMPVGTSGNGAAAFMVPAAPGIVSRVKA